MSDQEKPRNSIFAVLRAQQYAPKLFAIGIVYGFIAGMIAGLVLALMHLGQEVLWQRLPQRGMIFPVIVVAGILIAVLDRYTPVKSLDEQIQAATDMRNYHRGRGLLIALSAFIAVVAGGAIGPEAGIIALITELSALVTLRVKESETRSLIAKIGVDAAVGALYLSPPGGAVYRDSKINSHTLINIVSAAAGVGGFITVLRLTGTPSVRMHANVHPSFSWWLVLAVVVAAIVGLAFAVAFNWFDYALKKLTERIGHRPLVIIGGSFLLAGVYTAWPALRFSGQHEVAVIGANPFLLPTWLLLVGAAAKLIAVSLTVRAGWRGGVIFPLLLVGTMVGSAIGIILPGSFHAAAAVSAVGATLTAVTRKPLLVFFVVLFLVPGIAYLPLLAGITVGLLAAYISPAEMNH